MIRDWNKEIAAAWLVQSQNEKSDVRKLWDYHPPRSPATDSELSEAEAVIGHPLDPRYREFLSFADGWACFYQDVTLFGTKELIGGKMMDAAVEGIGETFPESFKNGPLRESDLLPIAASATDKDLFVITRPCSPTGAGIVVWIAGYEIERYQTFDDFFLAMVEFNRRAYERFRAEMGTPGGE